MGSFSHNVNRIVVEANCTFAELRDRYEALVPANEKATALAREGKSWTEIATDVNAISPYGFFIFWKMDTMPIMRVAGHSGDCVEYLMGNFTIAERMFRHDPSVMLYAPLRTLIYTDSNGRTKFAVDQPSTIFSSFSNSEIASVGAELDNKLAGLLSALDMPVPV